VAAGRRWGIMRIFPLPIAALLLLAAPAAGQDILTTIGEGLEQLVEPDEPRRPAPRPEAPAVEAEAEEVGGEPPPLPQPRPEGLGEEAPEAEEPDGPAPEADEEDAAAPEPEPPAAEPEAEPEPERVYQTACPALLMGLIEAEALPPLSEGTCGERSPLVVTGVLVRGRMLPLSSPVTTNCAMASALPGWLEQVDGYASSVLESPLASVSTGTSYQCRARVGGDTEFTSEHGFANAVDVVGFTLEDGQSFSVEQNWMPADGPGGRLLRLAHDGACGLFTTVLGPEANAEHHDHLHLDLGCHGESCRAQLCE
jgi:hypothetical protein